MAKMTNKNLGMLIKDSLLVLILAASVMLTMASVAPISASASGTIYFEPENYLFDAREVEEGHRFNATIRIKGVTDMFAWQVVVYFPSTLLETNATRVWYAPDEPIHKGMSIPVTPVVEPAPEKAGQPPDTYYLLFGVSSLGPSYEVPEETPADLCIIEFEIVESPPGIGFVEANLTLGRPIAGVASTKWEDSVGTKYTHPELTLQDGYYKYTMPFMVTLLSPDNKTYPTSSVPLIFTVGGNTSWMGYSLDGGADVTIQGNTTLDGLSDGPHQVTVYANDTVGNMGSDTVHFTIDTIPPTIQILSPENKTYVGRSVPLTFTVSDSPPWMGYSLDGGADVTIQGNTTLDGLSDGPHQVTVYANDTVGNMGSDTVHFTIVVSLHDVAVLDVVPDCLKQVNRGEIVNILVLVENQGSENEIFNVTLFDNVNIVQRATVYLTAENQTDIPFIWNTTGIPMGNHTIKVMIDALPGETDTEDNVFICYVEVTAYPTCSFLYTPQQPSINETVVFDATLSQDNITRYLWDFGDGSPQVYETVPTTTHTYIKKGEYTVTLTVENALGRTDTCTSTLTVEEFPPPTPSSRMAVAATMIAIIAIGIGGATIMYSAEKKQKE